MILIKLSGSNCQLYFFEENSLNAATQDRTGDL